MTALLFRDDAYRQSCEAKVIGINERGGIILDQTVFYPTAGGQPGDKGTLVVDGSPIAIATTVYDETKNAVHVPAAPVTLAPGTSVSAELDWANRFRNMRCHSLMHLLCAAVPFPVTGSALTEDGGRIDFDIPEGHIPIKDELAAKINGWISEDHPITTRWIAEEELDANPSLVRTLWVKPPRGSGRIRLVAIGENDSVDLQPCGGTHLRSTGAIGPVVVAKIENKGKMNRRIRLAFAS
ncbi:alanyl-tRNA editing protein [Taklimakanibacter lacteus]|uniref:alanyl-tRNA editing protein n=1 Tax=Taklimakanibacter lacteus TaxID=2268456 RepID=UPI000E66F4A8